MVSRHKNNIDDAERKSELGAWFVVAGLAIEILLIVWEQEFHTKELATLAANIMIAGGVYAEIHYGRKVRILADEAKRQSDEKIAEANVAAADAAARVSEAEAQSQSARAEAAAANKAVAEAHARTREAELRIEQLRKELGPRHLNIEEFSAALKDAPKANIEIYYIKDDPECYWLSYEFNAALSSAGWEVAYPQALTESTSERLRDIPSHVKQSQSLASLAGGQPGNVSLVARSINHNKALEALQVPILKAFGRVGGGSDETLPNDVIRIIIAPKH